MITLINRSNRIKRIHLIKELEKYPLFTLKDLKEIINKGNEYSKLVLHRLKKDNLIFKIERNKYTIHNDPLIFLSSIVWPSYISCWTALRYYNLTEQLPQVFFVVTTRSRMNRHINYNNVKIVL